MSAHLAILAILAVLAASCSKPSDDPGGDVSDQGDTGSMNPDGGQGGGADAAGQDASQDASPQDTSIDAGLPITAENYCETTVDFFCDYYLRCGRMAADNLDECRTNFLESCNAVYEPRYRSFVDRGMLELSPEGVQSCREHLSTVDCSVQLFDLDLGCANMWVGTLGVGDPCAPGIGSFVCRPGTVCTLTLDFCGTCKEVAAIGEPCGGEIRCANDAQCINDECVQRALPGEACSEDVPCVLGASCSADVCAGFTTVAVGEPCDQARRCPYKSACIGGVCQETSLLGESCADVPCASGWCDAGICSPFTPEGEACASDTECLANSCNGTCDDVELACFR